MSTRFKSTAQAGLPGFVDPIVSSDVADASMLKTDTALSDFDLHVLALAQVRGIGIRALRGLIQHYDDPSRVWRDDSTEIAEILAAAHVPGSSHIADAIKLESQQFLAKGRRERDRLARNGCRLIGSRDEEFPQRLLTIPNHPLWLFIQGDPAPLNNPPLIAIVGTRKASDRGITTAQQLARLVIDAGLGIVSGLAEGIDKAAHTVAAKHSAPQVAVLGTGIDVMFPATNTDLRRLIVENGGVIITEYLPAEKYGRANFVQRNRIQAALAAAVCPVEGQAQSGTAHTIRFAREYNRPLFGATRETPDPENELVHALITDGSPVFELTTEQGRQALRSFLDTIGGDRAATPPPPGKEFWIRRVTKELADLQSYFDLSEDEKDRIIAEVARAIGRPIAEVAS